MSNLHRTQIYLQEEQMRRLKIDAGKKLLTVSELIRQAIERFMETETAGVNWENDSITKTVGRIKLGVSDASEKHDQYLYSKRKQR